MNQFLIASTIEELHVEITTQCNAACPMCARNNHGFGLADKLQLNSWKLGDELKVFSTDLPNLKRAFFCGTHGDPVAAPYLFEAVQACKNLGVIVEIFTNGSLRSGNWWTKITNILTKDDKIVNPIDYRLATMRRDCAEICSKVYNASHMDKGINFLEFCQRTYNFILMNDITEPDTDKPKVNTPSVWK